MAERGYGDHAIRLFLEGLGIPEAMAYESVRRISEELSEHMRMALIIEKRGSLPKKKLIRFLAGRGFPFDQIMDEIGGVDE
jgi:SOS response regulatory protein OraA/RecX